MKKTDIIAENHDILPTIRAFLRHNGDKWDGFSLENSIVAASFRMAQSPYP